MTTKPVERISRKRRSLLGMAYLLMINVLLVSFLAWFFLMIGFGIYRIHHSRDQTLSIIDAVIQPNINLLQTNALGSKGYQKIQTWLKQLNHGRAESDVALLNQKWQQAQKQIPKLHDSVSQFWQIVNQEIKPLFYGITKIITTRLGILLLALPLFALCLSLGLVDGLVQRDIRKFQGARESTLLFHELKRGSGIGFFVPLLIYFLWPWPLKAEWILMPLAIAMGLLTQLGAKSFKKYI